MRITRLNTSFVTVEVPAEDVYEFNRTFPFSNIPVTDISFEFQSNGDLVGIESLEGNSSEFYGPALVALANDAKYFAFGER